MKIKNKILTTGLALSIFTASLLAQNNEKVFAVVNGTNITETDVSIALKDQKVNYSTLPETEKKKFLDQVIQKKLLSQMALKSSVTTSDVYKKTLELTIQGLKEELALQIWMQDLSKDIEVSDKEVSDYYKNNPSLFQAPAQLNANHILLNTEEEAKDIINELSKSKALKEDFEKLAISKSTGPSGKDGGKLGWFAPAQMVPEFSKAASKLKINTITKTPVKTQFGFHVIYLNDKKKSKKIELTTAQNQIKAIIGQNKFKEKMDSVIEKETKKAKITYK